jgi:hypothetical protein
MESTIGSDNAWEKLQANFALGLSSNVFTLAGVVGAWIFLAKAEWVHGFWDQLLLCVSLAPVFMGDTINAYVCGRVVLESQRNWDDIKISPAGKTQIGRWHKVIRLLSIGNALVLALLLIHGLSPNPEAWMILKPLFLTLTVVSIARSQWFYHAHIVPLVPRLSGAPFFRRLAGILVGATIWGVLLWRRDIFPVSRLGVIAHGTFYFLLCALLHPLPSKFSIFRMPKNTRQAPPTGVEPVSAEKVTFLQEPLIRQELETWNQLGFTDGWRLIRMPLLELPLFEACGTCVRHQDGKTLLLILRSDVKTRIHRYLISWSPEKAFVTSDFGAPEAAFPGVVSYQDCPRDEGPQAFWGRHSGRVPKELDAGGASPADRLEMLIGDVQRFLIQGIKPPAEDSGAGTQLLQE